MSVQKSGEKVIVKDQVDYYPFGMSHYANLNSNGEKNLYQLFH
ncbi:hypothetical protein OAT16_02020 [Prolixibacteraceae bacterium]|nr:hypothetical protein [Prolixibacteraceae bacterium]